MAATEAPLQPQQQQSQQQSQQQPADMESFFRQAKYPLIKYTDMTAEMREEAMDVCITAVEKYPQDVEKCTQVGA
jgi:dynein light chain 4